ncbi:MAG TPA: hypothetical protein VKO42_00295 [Patescibacteria group bacterium]|nr:hypothetical protein [Patescibacteria group bacterium]
MVEKKKNSPFYDLVYRFPALRNIEGAEEVIDSIIPDHKIKLPLKTRSLWTEIFQDEFLSTGFIRFVTLLVKWHSLQLDRAVTLEEMNAKFKQAGCPTLRHFLKHSKVTKNLEYPYRFLLAQADIILPKSYPLHKKNRICA